MAFLPAMTFFPVWLYVMTKTQRYKMVFSNFWPMSMAMVFGSFIAGSTPLGGGVVGFPVSVLALGFDADQGRDFSAMIQAVGMTSASYLIIYLKPQLVDPILVSYSIIFGVVGCVVGFVVPVSPFAVNLTLTTYLVAFALVYCYKNEILEKFQLPVPPTVSERRSVLKNPTRKSDPNVKWAQTMNTRTGCPVASDNSEVTGGENKDDAGSTAADDEEEPPIPKKNGNIFATTTTKKNEDDADPNLFLRECLLAFSALVGGFVTAKLGSGSDSMAYIFAAFGWNKLCPPEKRLSESTMTASTVIIMATMSFVVVGIRMSTSSISPDVILCWAAAAPVVSFGAPIGALVLGPAAEIALRRFFYFIAALQFIMFAVIVIKDNVLGWTVVAVVVCTTGLGIALDYFGRFRPAIQARRHSPDKNTSPRF